MLNALTATIAATAIAACGQLARPLAETGGASATAWQPGPTVAGPAGMPPGARALAAELAVLRRPQTASDLLPERAVRTLPEAIIPSLTQLVATGHAAKLGGFRVYLVVVTAAPCAYEKWPSGAPQGGDRATLITVSTGHPDRFETLSMGFAARELELFAIIPVGPGEYWRGGGQVLSSVVPDGVTHVTWTFRWVRHPGGEKHRRYLTIRPAVHDNVAVAQIPPWETQAGATLTFRGGRVLTSKNEAADLPVCGVSSVVLGATNPIAPWLKQHFAIFRGSRATPPLAEPESGDAAGYFKRQDLGLNFARARFVATGTGLFGAKRGIWAVPGTTGACLIYGPPAGLGICGARISVESAGSGSAAATTTATTCTPDSSPTATGRSRSSLLTARAERLPSPTASTRLQSQVKRSP